MIVSESLHTVGVDVKRFHHTGRCSYPVFQTGNLLQVVQQVGQATIVSSAQVLDETAATKRYSLKTLTSLELRQADVFINLVQET